MSQGEAWINWNPDPAIHMWGIERRVHTLAFCGITVREKRADRFDPSDPKACPSCVEAVEHGYSFEEYSQIRAARTAKAIGTLRGFVCRR